MALTDEGGNGMVMPVAPMYGSGNGFGGFGDGNGWWIILLFILLVGGRGFGGYGGGGNYSGDVLYPWMNQADITTSGFQNAALTGQLNGIQSGINGLATQLCNCCSDTQMALANGFAGVEQGANARQMANIQAMNAIQAQLAQCCCDNRLATNDLKYTIATENCADRAALSDGIRDILAAQVAGFQSIKDQLCQDKIDSKNDTIAQLRQELLFARGQASQDVQTAELRANNATVANQLLSEMRSCPIPAQPVYGTQPIFTCNNGCACNSGFVN